MVSVVATTYNGEKFIIEQLESLRTQSMNIDEVLIADDRSSDKTVSVVQKYIDDNNLSGWSIAVNRENKGWRKNFVDVANKAHGDLIFFCDQDDIWMEHKIQVMSEVMSQHEEVGLLAGRYIKFQETLPQNPEIHNDGIHIVPADLHVLATGLPGCVYCVRKSFWDRISPYWNGTFAHDTLCWAPAKLLNKLYILEMPVIYWRRHEESATTIGDKELKSINKRIEWLENYQKNTQSLKNILTDFEKTEAGTINFKDIWKIVDGYEEFLALRIAMMKQHKPLKVVKLIKYRNYYDRKKQMLLELYLAMKRN